MTQVDGIKVKPPKVVVITGDRNTDLDSINAQLLSNDPQLKIFLFPEERAHPCVRGEFGAVIKESLTKHEQVVVLTFDNIIFNAIRLLVKSGELKSWEVSVSHFVSSESKYTPIAIFNNGRCSTWPNEGFGDVSSKQLDLLLE